jgi:hypothetical protein
LLQFLDADDLLQPDKLRPQVAYLLEHSECDAVYGDWIDRTYSTNGMTFGDRYRSAPDGELLEKMLAGQWVPLHGFLVRRKTAAAFSFDEQLKHVQDRDYWLRLALSGIRFSYVPSRDVAVYRRFAGKAHVSTTTRSWLDAAELVTERSLKVLERFEASRRRYAAAILESYRGLIEMNIANGFSRRGLGVARGVPATCIEDAGLGRAAWGLSLVGPMLRGIRNRVKARAKSFLYRLLGFDLRRTFRENVTRRVKGIHARCDGEEERPLRRR